MIETISTFDIIKTLLLLGIVLYATYYCSKLIATKASGNKIFTANKSIENNPNIIFRTMVDRQTSLIIVNYDGRDYFLACNSGHVEVLDIKELNDEEIQHRNENNKTNDLVFSKYLDKIINSDNKVSNGIKNIINKKQGGEEDEKET